MFRQLISPKRWTLVQTMSNVFPTFCSRSESLEAAAASPGTAEASCRGGLGTAFPGKPAKPADPWAPGGNQDGYPPEF